GRPARRFKAARAFCPSTSQHLAAQRSPCKLERRPTREPGTAQRACAARPAQNTPSLADRFAPAMLLALWPSQCLFQESPMETASAVLTSLALACALALSSAARAGDNDKVAFTPEAYIDHIKFLASDALEGRKPGTEGIEKAATYIAYKFMSFGLEP